MSNQNHDAPYKSNPGNDNMRVPDSGTVSVSRGWGVMQSPCRCGAKHEAAPAIPGNRDKQETGQHEKFGADKHRDGQKTFEKSAPPAGGRCFGVYSMQIRLIAGLAFACMLLAGGASAATTAKGEIMSPQQQRMAECSHQFNGMHGAAHKTFMNNCLKGHGAASMVAGKHEMAKPMMGSKAMQQEKMKDCSAGAKAQKLMGAKRNAFMSKCVKAH